MNGHIASSSDIDNILHYKEQDKLKLLISLYLDIKNCTKGTYRSGKCWSN